MFCLSVEYKKVQYGRLVNHYPNVRGPLTGKRELFLTNIVDNLNEDEYVISNTSACFYFYGLLICKFRSCYLGSLYTQIFLSPTQIVLIAEKFFRKYFLSSLHS